MGGKGGRNGKSDDRDKETQRWGSVSPPPTGPIKSVAKAVIRGTPRRSDRLIKKLASSNVKGDPTRTPRESSIHTMFDEGRAPTKEMANFKRRLQFKSGSTVMNRDALKELHRRDKLLHFHEDQRGKRDAAMFKSRGLSLPAASKTRKTVVAPPTKEGGTPTVVFAPRHNLRPRAQQATSDDTGLTLGAQAKRGSIEKRMSQYKRRKSESLNFVSWSERDEEWRKKRLDSYMSTSKTAREQALLKKRNLTIYGWGNPKKNLGNYLSICWDYNPDLDADKSQMLPGLESQVLNRLDDRKFCTESGQIYYPDLIEHSDNITGFCFTIQSELAMQYENAQKKVFELASYLVQQSFWQYSMNLSLDTSLDDGFTVDMFAAAEPDSDIINVRAVSQFIFMRGYIYVDKICVGEKYQKHGLGSFMMDRIVHWAKKRDKDIILYALGPVVRVYEKWGFNYCKEWPAISGDIGAIMRKRVKTAGAVEDYVGPQWDGTKFV